MKISRDSRHVSQFSRYIVQNLFIFLFHFCFIFIAVDKLRLSSQFAFFLFGWPCFYLWLLIDAFFCF